MQSMKGFDDLIADLRTRDLLGAYAEMVSLHLLGASGHSMEFVKRSMRRREDYDCRAVVGGQVVAVEVKAKREQPLSAFSLRTVVNSLNAARKQVPQEGPSIVFVYVPPEWAADSNSWEAMLDVARGWLRKITRVNAVVYIYERVVTSGPGPQVMIVAFEVVPNLRPKAPVRNILAILRHL